MSDIYLPAVCDACARVALVRANGGFATCPRCSSSVVVVPGEAYRDQDASLFKRIESILFASDLTPDDGEYVISALTDVATRRQNPQHCLSKVVDVIPSLLFVMDSFGNDVERLACAAGMVLAIVSARNLREREASQASSDRAAIQPPTDESCATSAPKKSARELS